MTRTHVVLADDVINAIDGLVGPRARSRFLEEAAREKLEREALLQAFEDTCGIISAEAHPEWVDNKAIAEWVRSVRRGDPVE